MEHVHSKLSINHYPDRKALHQLTEQ